MSDQSFKARRSSLAGLLAQTPQSSPEEHQAGVVIQEHDDIGLIVLRGQPEDAPFMAAMAEILGATLPSKPSTFVDSNVDRNNAGSIRILWVSPDEWWLLCPIEQKLDLLQKCTAAASSFFAQVVDNTGALTTMTLSGAEHLTVVRHLTPFDIESAGIGSCTSTVIPQASMMIIRPNTTSVVLIFRRSFATWVWQLISRSASPYGLINRASSG